MPAKNSDLHGSAPDTAAVALMLSDVINDMEFDGGEHLLTQALPMAERLAALKRRAVASGIPVIYANDNFGRWQSDFAAIVRRCVEEPLRGRPVARLLARDLDLIVPADCVASIDVEDNRRALQYMARVMDADVRPSVELDVARLQPPRAA